MPQRKQIDKKIDALLAGIIDAEAKISKERPDYLNDLKALTRTFLLRYPDDPVRLQLLHDLDAGADLTGDRGIRRRLGAIDLEYFGRAYFPQYFSRPSPRCV